MKNKYYLILLYIFIIFSMIFLNKTVVIGNTIDTEKSKDEKVIYLTFDDGPSDKITDWVLDILKEEKVPATFFVIGNQIEGREEMIKRICEEGHTIGLHTYSHQYSKVYKSKRAFLKEMLYSQSIIYKITGIKADILRFPGGSRKHLDSEFLEELHSYGFKIYDWNVPLSDGINPRISPSRLIQESKKIKDDQSPIIMLMHCDYMHKNTCIALPKIIDYYKKMGYQFKPITKETKELYFDIKSTPKKR